MNITVRVGDLGKVITGNTPPRSNPELYGNYIPFIKATDISENEKYTYTPEEYYSEEGFRKYKTSLIPKHSTCVVTIGSIGKKMTMACQDCFINQAMNAIIPNNDYDYEYVYYLLKNNIHKLKNLDSGTASGRENVSKSAFMGMELSVIKDKVTQKRIGSILSAYDDLIENNQKQIKLLEEAAQRLYKEWFVDLRFPGHEGVKVVDGVPKGWKKVRVDEVTSVLKRGISPKYDENGEFTVINQKCIRKNIVDYSESRKQSKKYAEELQLQESDTVICSTGIGTLGRVGQIYNVYQNSTFDSHVTLVRANKLIGKQFLFWSLKLLQPYLMSLGKGSTNQQELYKSDLAACLLLLPEEYIMNAFERQAQELHDIIAVKTKQISSLREARDRLLPKLMSGEIEV